MSIVFNFTAINKALFELSDLINQSQQQVALVANSVLNLLFWKVGNRINQDIIQHKRAD